MSDNAIKPDLKSRALTAFATNQVEEAKQAEEKTVRERDNRRLALLGTLDRTLGITPNDPAAEVDPDGYWAIMDGIYFEAGNSSGFDRTILNVYLDQQDGEGAKPFGIPDLIALGMLFEKYGDGNLVDLREYEALWWGVDDDAVQRLMPKADTERLLASNEGWSRAE